MIVDQDTVFARDHKSDAKQLQNHPVVDFKKRNNDLLEQLQAYTREQDYKWRHKLKEEVKSESSSMECSITLDCMKEPVLTACGHYYDGSSDEFNVLISHPNATCPTCRANLSEKEIQKDGFAKKVTVEFNADPVHALLANPNMQVTSDIVELYKLRRNLRLEQIPRDNKEALKRYHSLKLQQRVDIVKRIFRLDAVFPIQNPVLSRCGHYVEKNNQICKECNVDVAQERDHKDYPQCFEDDELMRLLNTIQLGREQLLNVINVRNAVVPNDIHAQIEQYNQRSNSALRTILNDRERYSKLQQLALDKARAMPKHIEIELVDRREDKRVDPVGLVVRKSRIPANLLHRINALIDQYENVRTCFFRGRRNQKHQMWVALKSYIDDDANQNKSFAQCVDTIIIHYPDALKGIFSHATADLVREVRAFNDAQDRLRIHPI